MSKRIGIVAADGARARFITAEVVDDPAFEGSPRMLEHDNVVNPPGVLPSREVFADRPSRKPSGAARVSAGGGPATDDHRERHEAEDGRRFAKQVAEAAQRFAAEQQLTQLVLAAGPSSLGTLREPLAGLRSTGVDLVELPLDLSAQSLSQVREVLVKRGLLPAPELPRGGVFRPRGQEPSTR
jgi:protein required for attachment to host cells